jgi:NAD+ kinase
VSSSSTSSTTSGRAAVPSSETGSDARSRKPVRRAALLTHGKAETIGPALPRVVEVARNCGVELLVPEDEVAKHGLPDAGDELEEVDLAVVLGGDGTMLRALQRFLGTPVPVLGVNFGRVGFLASIPADELETGLMRAFAGELVVEELPTLEAAVGGEQRYAVNDVVVRSADVGRMIELGWALGGEDLGSQPCDGLICSTPTGSTAYNLSNGGPVLVWGLEAMAVTFVAPHSLHARPLVVPAGRELLIVNRTTDVPAAVIVDGHLFTELGAEEDVSVSLDGRRSLLASLPETTFFRRYRDTFAS